eukprot:m.113179 g.113179  ORF g.113179 m.113179 type:complete len:258 (-) comp13503_c0_seq9:238-1011(-)
MDRDRDKPSVTARLRSRMTTDAKPSVHKVTLSLADASKYVTIQRELGRGTFGIVFVGHTQHNKEPSAIKRLDKKPKALKLIEVEISVLERAQHPHIVQLIEVVTSPRHIFLVLELCNYGDLSSKLEEYSPAVVPDRVAARISLQLGDALAYLHHLGIAHRDVKCGNVLIRDFGSINVGPDGAVPHHEVERWDVCLTDFGLSAEQQREPAMTTKCGTPPTMAPGKARLPVVKPCSQGNHDVHKRNHEISKQCHCISHS